MRVRVKWRMDEVRAQATYLESQVQAAAVKALNRAADATATASGRDISKQTSIPVRTVRQRLEVVGASKQRLRASIIASSYAPNLAKFGRPTQKAPGVAATAWGNRKVYRHSFTLPSGPVVTRTTDQRLPLKGLRGPSVRKTFMNDRTTKVMQLTAEGRFIREFERQLGRRRGKR